MSPNLFQQTDLIEARRVVNRGKGSRAVVATCDIAKDQIIERVPVILIPRNQVFGDNPIAKRSARISWYVFDWIPTKRDYVALCLGYGSLYNHSPNANAMYEKQLPDIMCFIARRNIACGEEITIDYRGGDSESDDLLGFEVDPHDVKAL